MGILDAHRPHLAWMVYQLCSHRIKRLLGHCSADVTTQEYPPKNWNYLRASFAPRRSRADSILAPGLHWDLSPKSSVWSTRWLTCGDFGALFLVASTLLLRQFRP